MVPAHLAAPGRLGGAWAWWHIDHPALAACRKYQLVYTYGTEYQTGGLVSGGAHATRRTQRQCHACPTVFLVLSLGWGRL